MKSEFRLRLQKALSASGMNAAELSEKTGISEANISNYLNGKYVAKQDKCFLLAKALDVDPGWLMTGYEPAPKFELNWFGNQEDEPKNDDVRLLIRGLNKLSPQQLEQATNMMKVMFAEYAPYFEKENNDNDA